MHMPDLPSLPPAPPNHHVLQAVQLFEKFFDIARSLDDRKILDTARFNLGVAKGALRLDQYMDVVACDLPTLLEWKNSRADFH